MNQDEWTHLVFVREGRGGIWYKNGKPDRPKRGNFYIDIGSNKPANPPIQNFRIGAAPFHDGLRYRGVIDEAFIFERALSQDEVQRIITEKDLRKRRTSTPRAKSRLYGEELNHRANQMSSYPSLSTET